MPTNKNAQLRYRILDRCFSDRQHQYTIDDLVEKVNEALTDLQGTEVSVRQIREDLRCLRERVGFDAPIKAYPLEGRKCYYRYEDPDFRLFSNELSTEEVQTLRSTISMLGRYRGIPANAWLEEVISNLEYRFGVKPNRENAITFDQNEQLKGLEHLSTLLDHILVHQPLRIHYRTYSGSERTTVVHPYHLKQYNNRWFLFGLQEGTHGPYITNKALDRIVGISPATDIKFIPSTTDFSTYFNDIVGVTLPQEHLEPEEVVLRFDAARFPYIVSKPIHPSQRVVSGERRELVLHVRPNKELEAEIFSFGPQCEVLRPEWLRRQIAEKLQAAVKQYTSVKIDCTDEE